MSAIAIHVTKSHVFLDGSPFFSAPGDFFVRHLCMDTALEYVNLDHVAVLDQCDQAAIRSFRAYVTDAGTAGGTGKTAIGNQRGFLQARKLQRQGYAQHLRHARTALGTLALQHAFTDAGLLDHRATFGEIAAQHGNATGGAMRVVSIGNYPGIEYIGLIDDILQRSPVDRAGGRVEILLHDLEYGRHAAGGPQVLYPPGAVRAHGQKGRHLRTGPVKMVHR